MINKRVFFQHPFDPRDYGEGTILDKYLKEGTEYYLIKVQDGNVRHLPCYFVKVVR